MNYDKNFAQLEADGYKRLEKINTPIPADSYIEYQELFDTVKEILVEPSEEQRLNAAKSVRLQENERKRDEFLNAPVFYKDLDWDADLDQKINLAYKIDSMKEDETCVWVSADGMHSLNCTKEDLLNIFQLLVRKTTYVWQIKNPYIKNAILDAKTIEELNAIDINYQDILKIEGDSMVFTVDEHQIG